MVSYNIIHVHGRISLVPIVISIHVHTCKLLTYVAQGMHVCIATSMPISIAVHYLTIRCYGNNRWHYVIVRMFSLASFSEWYVCNAVGRQG